MNDDPDNQRGRPRTWHTDENSDTAERLIGEDLKTKTSVQHFTPLGKERCGEAMFIDV
jgi:hypothetical protein